MYLFLFVATLFCLAVFYLAVEDQVLKTSALQQRLFQAFLVYRQNPFFFLFFLMRSFFMVLDGNLTGIVVAFFYLPMGVFIAKLFFDLCMKNARIKKNYATFVSDNAILQKYWREHLQWFTWVMRLIYAISFGYVCFSLYATSQSMHFDMLHMNGIFFECSPQTLASFGDVWFGLKCLFTANIFHLTVQLGIVNMLPVVEGKLMQNCRYCLNSAGKLVLVCTGGGFVASDLIITGVNGPHIVIDQFRYVQGLPLFESAAGYATYQNIQFLVHSGQIDLKLITDPKTGRISDELMLFHLRTTYKELVREKCAAGFSTAVAAPEDIVTKACYSMAGDFVRWVKKHSPFTKRK